MRTGAVISINTGKKVKKNSSYKNQVYDELISSFNNLESALEKERNAILALEEKSLEQSGVTIDNILSELSEKMLSAKSLNSDQTRELARVISRVREKRQNNRMLLEDVIQETGRAIGRVNSGRRVLQAYSNPASGEELFVKKEC